MKPRIIMQTPDHRAIISESDVLVNEGPRRPVLVVEKLEHDSLGHERWVQTADAAALRDLVVNGVRP